MIGRPPLGLLLASAILCLSAQVVLRAQESPAGPPERDRCGVNAHLPLEEEFALMEKLGIGWARIDLTWDMLEPEPGDYQWGVVDHVVALAQSHRIRLLGILGYCPPWASSGPDPYYPPKDQAEWTRFVGAVTSRYLGCIDHWCLWNEPDNPRFFHGSVEQYIRQVLVPGAAAAKAAAPACRIVGPDLAHLQSAHWDHWLAAVLSEAGGCIDVIGHHCYRKDAGDLWRALEGPTWPWDPKPVLGIIRDAGQGDKPVWLTEVGWRSDRIGERTQADNAAALLEGLASRPWLAKVFLFELEDSPFDTGYGLARADGSPKPAFAAVRRRLEASPPAP